MSSPGSAVDRRNEQIVVGGGVVGGGVASDEAVAAAAAGTSAKATALWQLVAAKEHETEKDETDAAEEAAAYSRCDSIAVANQTVALAQMPSRFFRTRFGRCAWR